MGARVVRFTERSPPPPFMQTETYNADQVQLWLADKNVDPSVRSRLHEVHILAVAEF